MPSTERYAPARQPSARQQSARQPTSRDDDRYYPGADIADDEPDDVGDDWEIPPVHNRQGVVAPVGFYVGQLEKMTREKKTRFAEYLRIRFDFRVLAVISARDRAKAREVEGQVISGWANLTMGPRSTMRAWAEALLDRTLEEDEQPGKADLLGCMCEISIVPHETEQGEQTTKIGSLSPYRPDDLEPDQQPQRDDQPTHRPPPPEARRASPQEMSGRPGEERLRRSEARPPRSAQPEPDTAPAGAAQADAEREPWEDEDDAPAAVDPVLQARARGRP